jgi:response regulator of citrate/malate metabolism
MLKEQVIFVCDEDPFYLVTIKDILLKSVCNCCVELFSCPGFMLKHVTKTRPLIFLIDLVFHCGQGTETIKKIRNTNKESLIFVVTEEPDDLIVSNFEKYVISGADSVIKKQNINSIPKIINEYLNYRNDLNMSEEDTAIKEELEEIISFQKKESLLNDHKSDDDDELVLGCSSGIHE